MFTSWKRFTNWLRQLTTQESPGERALREVAEMVVYNMQAREKLRKTGWRRLSQPPFVGGQWVWFHPSYGSQLESEAVRIASTMPAATTDGNF